MVALKSRWHSGWRCAEVTFTDGRVTFADAGPELKPRLEAVPTRFKLDPATIDLLVEGGATALRRNTTFRQFLGRLPRRAVTVALADDRTLTP